MKITVLGAGAMGSLFGGLLAEAGYQVELIDVNPDHIARVREQGLLLDTDSGQKLVKLPICRPEEATPDPDWLIVFTKTLHTISALESTRQLIGDETRVLTLQNGLGNAEKIAGFIPLSRVAIGITTVPADMVEPGHIHSRGQGFIKLMMSDGLHEPSLDALAAALGQSGLPCSVDASVHSAIWEKVAFNAALNSLCAVTGCTVGELGAAPAGRELAHMIAEEVLAVARTQGVDVNGSAVATTLDHAMDHHINHKPSMLQDLLAGRPTEIEAINGEVLRRALRDGVVTPCTKTLHTLVHLKENQQFAPGAERLLRQTSMH